VLQYKQQVTAAGVCSWSIRVRYEASQSWPGMYLVCTLYRTFSLHIFSQVKMSKN